MSDFDPYQHIVRPVMTERSTTLKEKFNQYVFEVRPGSNKPEIARAVAEIFKVRVRSVRTMNVRGKARRVGRSAGVKSDWKKAVVSLEPGQKIDLVEQGA